MSKCDNCGRDDGHWLGCAVSKTPPPEAEHPRITDAGVFPAECSFPGCEEDRRSEDKRVKFCTEHSDPKNRK